jgi:parallel beta-helix repeat protein
MKRKLSAAVFFAAAAMLAWAASAGAVDGTIEINQAKVQAAAGFPYKITSSGSYRLTGNLTVPASTDGIDVTAANVTIDLNGFLITGPGSTESIPIGINASGKSDVTVENGTVTGFGTGAQVGPSGIVKNVHADANGFGINGGNNTLIEGCTANNSTQPSGVAIFCAAGCVISGNTANGNPNIGIGSGNGSVISGNVAFHNTTGTGIYCQGTGCLITGNTAFNNGVGITGTDATMGYGGNVLDQTNNVSFGTNLGHNLCSGTICP